MCPFKWTNAAFAMTVSDIAAKGRSQSVGAWDSSTKVISISNNIFAAKKESFSVKDLDIDLHLSAAKTEIKALKVKAAVSHLKGLCCI